MLDADLRDRLRELLDTPGVTCQQIADEINTSAGRPVTSKSGVHRHAQRLRRLAAKHRQALVLATELRAQLGDEGQQDLSEVTLQQLRLLSFDLIVSAQELNASESESDSSGTERIKQLGEIVSRASRSLRETETAADRSAARRHKLRAETAAEAADAAASEAKAAGLSDEMVDALRTRVLGVA